jgi:hypothetical protein
MNTTDYFVWGMLAHLVSDWLLQNHWMAQHKHSLKHEAAWVHAIIQTIGLLLVFPPLVALVLGVAHLLIDTRRPLNWWRVFYRQTTVDNGGHIGWHVMIWGDQALHLLTIGIAALLLGGWPPR